MPRDRCSKAVFVALCPLMVQDVDGRLCRLNLGLRVCVCAPYGLCAYMCREEKDVALLRANEFRPVMRV